MEDAKFTEAQKDKVYIAAVNGTKMGYIPTSRKENVYTARTKTLGKY